VAKRSHLAPFLEGPEPWLVLARNALPAIGVLWLGWSAALALFFIWFDGIAALGAMLALQIRAFRRLDPKFADIPFVLAWGLMMGLVGIPYWFMLGMFAGVLFPEHFWSTQVRDPVVAGALLAVLVSKVMEEARRGYDKMSEPDIRREFNWLFTLHLARIVALLTLAFVFPLKYFIVVLALALSYVEIYPMRSIRLAGGEYALDDENKNRSRD
jgi:hypothetical protein